MRGIPEEIIKEMAGNEGSGGLIYTSRLLKECRELNPWMPLEEFLRSGFDEIDCWIYMTNGFRGMCKYSWGRFNFTYGYIVKEHITHVMPLHKPEPPR